LQCFSSFSPRLGSPRFRFGIVGSFMLFELRIVSAASQKVLNQSRNKTFIVWEIGDNCMRALSRACMHSAKLLRVKLTLASHSDVGELNWLYIHAGGAVEINRIELLHQSMYIRIMISEFFILFMNKSDRNL
jgi:hypothetical protein